ncbi:MAG: hypothetical protein H6891_13240 [Brucellaceae bacterium]|nr:hypothetical protein [Brucellaceae bacterium]
MSIPVPELRTVAPVERRGAIAGGLRCRRRGIAGALGEARKFVGEGCDTVLQGAMSTAGAAGVVPSAAGAERGSAAISACMASMRC